MDFILDTTALKFAIGLHKPVAMIFFEITIQRAVGDEPCYLMKNTLIITLLYNKSRKTNFIFFIQG
jgi:hypothetical protein